MTRPETVETTPIYDGCENSWAAGDFLDPGKSCTDEETQTRVVTCRRALDGSAVEDGLCDAEARPTATRLVADYDACGYEAVDWNTPVSGSTCSASTTKTSTAQCRRSDGTIVPAADCEKHGVTTSRTESGSDYSGCSSHWSPGAYADPGASCTSAETQTREVTCVRDLDGAVLADTSCDVDAKPSTTTQVADYSSCSYAAGGSPTLSDWTSHCSASATRTTTRACLRSDGTTVDAAECAKRDVILQTSETKAIYDQCSNSWVAADFVDPGASCTSAETQTRAVTCQRDLDHAVVADGLCVPADKPAGTRQVADYTSCDYAAGGTTTIGDWDSHCSADAKRTITRQCVRSDGTTVDATQCDDRGVQLQSSESGKIYDQCAYSWVKGAFIDPGASCTATETQTRAVTCQRDIDHEVVADKLCSPTVKPAGTQQVADYSNCSYSATSWTTTSYASSCSSSTTATQTAKCLRSEGTLVTDTECTSRGIALTRSVANQSNFAGCSYSRGSQTSSSWSSGCAASATNTVTYSCRRSDGATAASSECTSRGISLQTSSTGANYASCTYTMTDKGTGACSNGSKPHYWQCQRNQTGEYVYSGTYCGRENPTYEPC